MLFLVAHAPNVEREVASQNLLLTVRVVDFLIELLVGQRSLQRANLAHRDGTVVLKTADLVEQRQEAPPEGRNGRVCLKEKLAGLLLVLLEVLCFALQIEINTKL